MDDRINRTGLDPVVAQQLARACAELERRLQAGEACSAQQLVEQLPGLASCKDAALELIYTEYVIRQELGQKPSPHEWIDRFPQWRLDLLELFQVHKVMGDEGQVATGIEVDTPPEYGVAAPPELWGRRIGQYEILEEVGRGGMGIVYKARQLGLDRIVALKMMLSSQAGLHERARFRSEAESVARLQHPNIVQVYEVGEYDGRPYLSMEFVDGGRLNEDLAQAPLKAQAAAQLVEALALAVHYAHQHGVIHRDLKPANVLLSRNGVPKIMDFGLAKQLQLTGHGADEPEKDDRAERSFEKKGSSDNHLRHELTRSWAVLGTPCYISPEQASGLSKSVGPPADVYGLGAILYELLCGRPPFQGETPLEVLEQVRSKEVIAPRYLRPQLPRDINTICVKCLEKHPSRRYHTAADLANDLRRFLEKRPIQARPVGVTTRAARWCQRRPAVACLAAALIVVSLGSIISLSVLWLQARAQGVRLLAAKTDLSATNQRLLSESASRKLNYDRALRAVDEMLTEAADRELADVPYMSEVRRRLLTRALEFYEEFLAGENPDPQLRRETADVCKRVAGIHDLLGKQAAAEQYYQRAIELYTELADQQPDQPDFRHEIASCWNELGNLYGKAGRLEESIATHQKAIAIRAQLIDQYPGEPEYRIKLARSYNNLAIVYQSLKDVPHRDAATQRAVALAEEVTKEHPEVVTFQEILAEHLANAAVWDMGQGRWEEAESSLLRTIELYTRLPEPASRRRRYRLAQARMNLYLLDVHQGRVDQAEAAVDEARRELESLAEDFPAVAEYQFDLTQLYLNLARQARKSERLDDAAPLIRRAVETGELVVRRFPGRPDYARRLGDAYLQQLDLLLATHQPRDVQIEATKRAVDHYEKFVAQYPSEPEFTFVLGKCYYNLGMLLLEAKQPEAVLDKFARAVATLDPLLDRDTYRERAERLLMSTNWGRAAFYAESGRHSEAVPAWRAALKYDSKNDPNIRRGLALALAHTGQHQEACALAGELGATNPTSGYVTWELACIYALSCRAVAKDLKLDETARNTLVDRYARQAVEWLQQVRDSGYKTAEDLADEEILQALRDRPAFKQLVGR